MERHGGTRSASMQRNYQASFLNFCRCPGFDGVGIGAITKAQVLDFMHARVKQDGVCPATANKDVAVLKCLLSCAVEWDILERNPLQGLKLFPVRSKRDVRMTVQEAKRLIEVLPSPVSEIVEFAIYTGFRKENVLSLKIEQVRFYDLGEGGEADLLTKGGRTEAFPLSPLAADVIRRVIGDRKEGYVFLSPVTGTRYVSIHHTFNRAVRSLGLNVVNGTKLRIHDLRHAFANWLYEDGVTLDNLRSLLGHKDRSTTDMYVTVERLRLGRKVFARFPDLREKGTKASRAPLARIGTYKGKARSLLCQQAP